MGRARELMVRQAYDVVVVDLQLLEPQDRYTSWDRWRGPVLQVIAPKGQAGDPWASAVPAPPPAQSLSMIPAFDALLRQLPPAERTPRKGAAPAPDGTTLGPG